MASALSTAAKTHPHVLITGGTRGIGLAIAQLFAAKGYRCTLISRSQTSCEHARQVLQSSLPSNPKPNQHQPTHTFIPADISTAQFWTSSSLSTHLPLASSRIDTLINCAGITQQKLFQSTSSEELQNIMDTNLTGLMIGTQALLRRGYFRRGKEKKGEDGDSKVHSPVIINVASLLGVKGGFGAVGYAASKAGVIGFTRALATEYAAHKVRVNAIVPGYIHTDMTKTLDQLDLAAKIPLGRLGEPSEIAHAALFLAENEYAHNCVINLDGGLSSI